MESWILVYSPVQRKQASMWSMGGTANRRKGISLLDFIWASGPLLQHSFGGTVHFFSEIHIEFPIGKGCNISLQFLPGFSGLLFKHSLNFFYRFFMVSIYVDDIFQFEAFWLWPVFLLLCGSSEYYHGIGKGIGGEMEKFPVYFKVFHYIPYVAGADSHGLGCHNSILGGNHAVLGSKE